MNLYILQNQFVKIGYGQYDFSCSVFSFRYSSTIFPFVCLAIPQAFVILVFVFGLLVFARVAIINAPFVFCFDRTNIIK